MIPIIDLILHGNNNSTSINLVNNKFIFNSNEEYQENSVLSHNYGTKSNLEFYFHYNFIPDNNLNKLSINITNTKIKELFENKLQNIALDYNVIQPDLLALCRFQSLSESKIDEIYDNKNIKILYDFINLENELCAYQLLLNIFSNCKKDIEQKVKLSLEFKNDNNLLLQNFSKIFLNLNDTINKSILIVLFLWNKILNSPINFNINLE
jgi:hypothetical protein